MIDERRFKCRVCGAGWEHDIAYVVDGYPVCRCSSCGVGRVSIEDFDPYNYYDAGYYSGGSKHSYLDYVGSRNVIKKEFSSTVDFLRKIGPKNGKLLEIGCAYGFFIEQAKTYYEVYGVEIVDEAAKYCQANGLKNVKSGVLSSDYMDLIGELDVVVMLDVIEHIDNVDEVMRLVSDGLRENGVLLVTTGDWGSVVAKLAGPRWRLMAPPLHLWYFTVNSLKSLGQRFGLEVVSVAHPWKFVPLNLVSHQLSVMLGLKKQINLPGLVSGVGVPANLFDALRVVFKKVSRP